MLRGLGSMFTELVKLKSDYKSALSGSNGQVKPPFKFQRRVVVLLSYEFQLVLCFRLYSELYRSKFLRPLGLILYQLSKFLFKADIHPGARINKGFHLVHGFNVIIGGDAILGSNVCLFDGVSLGKKKRGDI